VRIYRTLAAAAALGLLYAWMESVFLQYGFLQRLAARGYEGANVVVLFLAVHSLTYLAAAFFPVSDRFGPRIAIPPAILMIMLPLLTRISAFLPPALSVGAALSGLILSAIGAALFIGRWGVFLSRLIPDDVALVFGLAPLVATFMMRLAAFSNILLIILGTPLLVFLLLFLSEDGFPEDHIRSIPSADFPLWRLSLFFFCLYAANGFLLSMIPELFPPSIPRAGQVSDWIRTISALSAAVIFRFYPSAELRTFYKGAFPLIVCSLFLLLFSPFQAVSRFLMETGLAFLDLYAWLLLIYFASRSGERRNTVVHCGIFLIIVAGAVSHLHLLLRNGAPFAAGRPDILVLVLPGVCLLLLMLVVWDGREIPLQWGGDEDMKGKYRDPDPSSGCEDEKGGASASPDDENGQEKESEMHLRMRLLEFNLTRQETEIALLLLQGLKDRNICSILYISKNTLKYHLRNIYRKTGSANRLELKEILD